jgi:uncharacterized Fe-S cluster-containing radical SAM superfamily protein
MSNSPLFLLDPNFGYPFARIHVSRDTTAIRTAVAVACAQHFEKPVKHVSAYYLEAFSTLRIIFRDGSDLYIDVDYDEPEIDDETPF